MQKIFYYINAFDHKTAVCKNKAKQAKFLMYV